jgi:hypothetical protein
MEIAINNMIDEIRKPVDSELSGSQRKAELQSIKQTATDAKELLIEYQRLEQMVRELQETGGIEAEAEACPNEIELLEGKRKIKTEHTTDGDFRANQKSFRHHGRQG